MMQLRPYQEKLSFDTRKALAKYRKVLMCLATGGGKTVISADIFARAVKKEIKPVFLTDRKEIARKTVETFKEWGLNVQLIESTTSVIYKADCYVAMVETFWRRINTGRFPKDKVKLIFCDECHMGVFNKVIEMFTSAYICGLTATPVSNTFNLNKVYEKIVTSATTPELIANGFLCPSIDIGQQEYLDLKMERGEFTLASQRDAFTSSKLNDKFIQLWNRHASNRSTIVYCIDVEHAERMHSIFSSDLGITSCVIHAKTPDEERDNAIKEYNSGNIQVMFNVDVASKGFDSPITSCIGHHCSTASLSRWYQRIGRGGRLNEGKTNFITIDTGNNIPRHGSFNDYIDWEFLFNNPDIDIKKKKIKPKKLCPTCFAYLANEFVKECPVCETRLNPRMLIALSSLMPEELRHKPIHEMNRSELTIYARYKGYKPNWVYFTMKSRFANQRKRGELL